MLLSTDRSVLQYNNRHECREQRTTNFYDKNLPTSAVRMARALGADNQTTLERGTSLNVDAVRIIAQSINEGLALAPGAAEVLAPDAEYRLREIVQDAIKFMRHSHRDTLATTDIDSALRLRNVEPIFGFGESTTGPRKGTRRMSGQKGTTSEVRRSGESFREVRGYKGGLFFVEDEDLNLQALVEAPLPAIPWEPTMSVHWLAINGVQPTIAQNPLTSDAEPADYSRSNLQSSTGKPRKRRRGSKSDAMSHIKPILKHELSKELQQYFEYVTASLAGPDKAHRNACLLSIAEEPGLIQLLPYLTQFIKESSQKSLLNLPWLFTLMYLARSIIANPNFNVKDYLHQMLPCVMTCIVRNRLSAKPRDKHWLLRDYSSSLVADICERFGGKFPSLQPRISSTLENALINPEKPLTTHYGAIVGLGFLGFRVVESIFVPHLMKYSELVEAVLEKYQDKPNSVRRLQAAKVYGAMAWCCSIVILKQERGLKTCKEGDVARLAGTDFEGMLPNSKELFSKLYGEMGSFLVPRTRRANALDLNAKDLLSQHESPEKTAE